MPRARHRVNTRGAARTGLGKLAGLAVLSTTVTATVVTAGIAGTGNGDAVQAKPASFSASAAAAVGSLDLDRVAASRQLRVSRTADRVRLEPEPVDQKFATGPTNVWTEPRQQGKKVRVLARGTKVPVTGQVVGRWSEVLLENDVVRWVNSDLLSDEKPAPKPRPAADPAESASSAGSSGESTGVSAGVSTAACAHGSGPEAGLTQDAVEVYRAVCAAFSGVSSYGGYAPRGEHYDGRAIDVMVSGSYGQQIADWLRVNASSLQIRDIIYAQRIWTPDRAAEGWRYMEDRGSPTANHYDHVHVAVY
jgi:hypothetical protein